MQGTRHGNTNHVYSITSILSAGKRIQEKTGLEISKERRPRLFLFPQLLLQDSLRLLQLLFPLGWQAFAGPIDEVLDHADA
jgi:hypothetical protein